MDDMGYQATGGALESLLGKIRGLIVDMAMEGECPVCDAAGEEKPVEEGKPSEVEISVEAEPTEGGESEISPDMVASFMAERPEGPERKAFMGGRGALEQEAPRRRRG